MCLNGRPRKTREIVLALMKEFPSGVPYPALLQVLRPKHHYTLVGLKELLVSGQDPTTKLTGPALKKFRDLLAHVEDCVRRGPKDSAIDQSTKIIDGYVPTMADVQLIYEQVDQCGHQYVEQQMHQLRKALEKNTCTCCPAEFVPQRAYLVLSKQSETLADERRRMLPFAGQFRRTAFRSPLGMVEHRGLPDSMWDVRLSIGTGCIAGSSERSIPESEIKSPEILDHFDRIRSASEQVSKLFPLYYFARGKPVAGERFLAEWAKPVAGRLAAFMDNIRNFILDEVNAMFEPDLAQPLPRIMGCGVFPKDWGVKYVPAAEATLNTDANKAPAAQATLNLDELTLEFEILMQFALEHRGDDPLPPAPKPRRWPTLHGARLVPCPTRPRLPRKKKSQGGDVRAPRRGSSSPA